MAAMYAIYHGAEGLKTIAYRVGTLTNALANQLSDLGFEIFSRDFFDTVTVKAQDSKAIRAKAEAAKINFHYTADNWITISLDETTRLSDVADIINIFANTPNAIAFDYAQDETHSIPGGLIRTSDFLQQEVFNTHHSESQMMRYIKFLENKDLSLNTSMISLGSCTMKLNAATEMMPLSWAHWSKLHPFAPSSQTGGYQYVVEQLSKYLSVITHFDACSLQPNSGAQGEYAGLLSIRAYHESRGDHHRNIIIIPISAHGTNPASAVMAGYKVVVVKALENGYVDLEDLKLKVEQHSANLAGIMITYPSTYGVFEETIIDITNMIHQHGGQVYMDGANMNAQVGLTAPGLIGADVCHLNLHKTFAIPHGGGGPGVGPICVKAHLAPFLPGHVTLENSATNTPAISSAPYGSASILLISYAYCCMLGANGLKDATRYAILNANYMKSRLQNDYEILYNGVNGTCAHEFIVDLRPLKKTSEIEAEDVAKRLMDYGFHAPTMSFPVAGTIMIEPTESEDKAELDRFCDALLAIRAEIASIENGNADKKNNLLKNAPHTQSVVINSNWDKPYTREQAVYPLPYVSHSKFWPTVSRINNTHGDRNLICTCEPTSAYA
jgi:glycine dehydrogenase